MLFIIPVIIPVVIPVIIPVVHAAYYNYSPYERMAVGGHGVQADYRVSVRQQLGAEV